MPPGKIDFDHVRTIALKLPGVEESTMRGARALKVRGKLLACTPIHKSAEPGSLAVRVNFDHRAELLASSPDIYYVTDHYLNYPTVLVRLAHIHSDALSGLLDMAWRFVTAKK
ncbi:MAG: MmcQ/YjbR family DNA-binding protein [Acidobacteriota bacterium]